jgi:hypothetical protein
MSDISRHGTSRRVLFIQARHHRQRYQGTHLTFRETLPVRIVFLTDMYCATMRLSWFRHLEICRGRNRHDLGSVAVLIHDFLFLDVLDKSNMPGKSDRLEG